MIFVVHYSSSILWLYDSAFFPLIGCVYVCGDAIHLCFSYQSASDAKQLSNTCEDHLLLSAQGTFLGLHLQLSHLPRQRRLALPNRSCSLMLLSFLSSLLLLIKTFPNCSWKCLDCSALKIDDSFFLLVWLLQKAVIVGYCSV